MQAIWTGNGQAIAQVVRATLVSIPAAGGGKLSASINGKSITYTTLPADTLASAVAAWQALLADTSTAPAEFGEVDWTTDSTVLQGQAQNPGTPFSVLFSASGGAALVAGTTTPNSSPSDVTNPANWLRGGFTMLPQDGDDLILANSTVPLLWNLDGLKTLRANSLTRWQSFEAQVGLPENNPAGYLEYRPTYFQVSGPPVGTLNLTLGLGRNGNGPSRERYNTGNQQTLFNVLASGSAEDDYAVRLLGGNGANTLRVVGTSVGVAMLPGEQAALSQAIVDGGGSLALGPGVLFGQSLPVTTSGSSSASPTRASSSLSAQAVTGGTVLALGGAVDLFCAPACLDLRAGSQATVQGQALSYPQVKVTGGAQCAWLCGSSVGALFVTAFSIFDKSGNLDPMAVGALAIDADTCQLLDPNNTIAFGAVTYNNAVASGPIVMGAGRKLTIQ